MKKFNQLFGLIIVVFSLFLIFIYVQEQNALRNDNWNVILISLDTFRADHSSSFGYERITTPNIDKFAEESIVFEKAFSSSNWTLPSHTSIFSSQPPGMHNAVTTDSVVSDETKLLAEVLKENNYQTKAITGGGFLSVKFGLMRGFDSFDKNGLRAKNLFSEANQWLDERNENEKFFLFLHTFQPHDPYFRKQDPFKTPGVEYVSINNSQAGEYVKRMFNDGNFNSTERADFSIFSLTTDFSTIGEILEKIPEYPGPRPTYVKFLNTILFPFNNNLTINDKDSGAIIYLTDSYDSTIHDADFWFGEFIKKLEEKNLLDNTIVILLSDHGEAFLEHGKIFHSKSLYNEEIHVPLIIRLPNGYSKRIREPVTLLDVTPTIFDLLKIPKTENFRGNSLSPFFYSTKTPTRAVFSENLPVVAVIQGDWKLIQADVNELYNIKDDPLERNNLFEEFPEKANELTFMINEYKMFNEKNSSTITNFQDFDDVIFGN